MLLLLSEPLERKIYYIKYKYVFKWTTEKIKLLVNFDKMIVSASITLLTVKVLKYYRIFESESYLATSTLKPVSSRIDTWTKIRHSDSKSTKDVFKSP